MQPAAQSPKATLSSSPSHGGHGLEVSVGGSLVSGSAPSGLMASALPILPHVAEYDFEMKMFDGLVMKMVLTTGTLLSLNLPLPVTCHPLIILRMFPHHSLLLFLPNASLFPNFFSLQSGLSARL